MRKTAAVLLAAPLMMPVALNAQAPDLPPRKAGLWEVTMTMEAPKGMPPITSKMCIDPVTDREMMDYALKMEGACKTTTKREGKTVIIDGDCTIGGKRTKSRTVLSGDFQSGYTTRTEGTVDGRRMAMAQTATWKSADCPGMRPGDVTLFGGMKLNVKQLKDMSGMLR